MWRKVVDPDQASIPPMIFWSNSKFNQNLECSGLKMCLTDHNKILHMSRQCQCHDRCKFSLWSAEYVMNKSIAKLHWIVKFNRNIISRMGESYIGNPYKTGLELKHYETVLANCIVCQLSNHFEILPGAWQFHVFFDDVINKWDNLRFAFRTRAMFEMPKYPRQPRDHYTAPNSKYIGVECSAPPPNYCGKHPPSPPSTHQPTKKAKKIINNSSTW